MGQMQHTVGYDVIVWCGPLQKVWGQHAAGVDFYTLDYWISSTLTLSSLDFCVGSGRVSNSTSPLSVGRGGAIIVLNQLLIPKDPIAYYTAKEVAGFYKGISVDDT